MNETEFYRFRCEAGDEPSSAELLIFDVIGNWEDIGEISAKGFAAALSQLPKSVKRLDIHINSPGGSLFDANAIYSRLADHKSEKVVYIDGLAASAASIVAMVGHKVYIRANANMMIHLPSGLAIGNADDMRKMAGALDTVTESMLNVYQRRTRLERENLRGMLAAETWFSPEQAVEHGFADEVRGVVKAAASLGHNRVMFNGTEFDLSRFHNVPAFAGETKKGQPMRKVKAQEEEKEENGNGEKEKEQKEQEQKEKEKETPTPPAPPPQSPAGDPAKPNDPAAPVPPTPAAEFDKGVQAERNRVMALQALDRPATHSIIVAAIKDGKQVSEVYAACFDAMEKAGKQDARRSDADILNNIPPADGADGDNAFGTKLSKAVQAKLKRRGKSVKV
jgi:ATP-dependent protease ClpP protease subunit